MDALQGLFTIVPLDYLFAGGFALLIALDTLRSGAGRAAALAAALPVTALLISYLPDTAAIGGMLSAPFAEAGAFFLIAITLYFCLRRMGLEYLSGGVGQPIHAALAGVAATVVVVAVWLHVPVLESLWEFGPHLQSVLAEEFRLFWLLGAFTALAFARG